MRGIRIGVLLAAGMLLAGGAVAGELIVFDTGLTRSMLLPQRVEYSYALEDPFPVLKVYSELKQPLEVPGHENCEVRAVSVILDDQGHIIESKAHVWMD